jgi:hypothetical protein
MVVRLANDSNQYELELPESDSRNWIPDEIVLEAYHLKVPDTLPLGKYKLGIALFEQNREIELALKNSVKKDGFYDIAEVDLK